MELKKYITRELTKEEGEALSKDLTEVLIKHNAEMGVVSSISLMKRVEVTEEGIPSPLYPNGESDNTTEESPKTE